MKFAGVVILVKQILAEPSWNHTVKSGWWVYQYVDLNGLAPEKTLEIVFEAATRFAQKHKGPIEKAMQKNAPLQSLVIAESPGWENLYITFNPSFLNPALWTRLENG